MLPAGRRAAVHHGVHQRGGRQRRPRHDGRDRTAAPADSLRRHQGSLQDAAVRLRGRLRYGHCALRCTNIYGPGMGHKDSLVVRTMRAALAGRGVQIYGYGLQRRDLVTGSRVLGTDAVTLAQAQYQASELLLGVISHGYRVLEQPMTMRARTAGKTKKGNNLVYGMRYARVMGTWWRERSIRRCSASSRPKTSRSSSANLSMKSGR